MKQELTAHLYDLLSCDSSRQKADEAVSFIGTDSFLFDEAVRYATTSLYPVNMRAARVVDLSAEMNPHVARERLPLFVNHIRTSTTDGVKRGFLKVIDRFTPRDIDEELLGTLIDQCFINMLSPTESIAVKWYSITILNKIVLTIPDLKAEFIASLEDQVDKNSAAMGRLITKMLQQLSRDEATRKRSARRPASRKENPF